METETPYSAVVKESLFAPGFWCLGFACALLLCFGTFGCASFDRAAQTPRYITGQVPEELQLTDTASLVSLPRTEATDSLEEQIGPGVGRYLASVPEKGKVDGVPNENDHDVMETPSKYDLKSNVPQAGK